jgi:hypothetical protein
LKRATLSHFFDAFSLLAAGIVNKFIIFAPKIGAFAIRNVALANSNMKSRIRNPDALRRAAEV